MKKADNKKYKNKTLPWALEFFTLVLYKQNKNNYNQKHCSVILLLMSNQLHDEHQQSTAVFDSSKWLICRRGVNLYAWGWTYKYIAQQLTLATCHAWTILVWTTY